MPFLALATLVRCWSAFLAGAEPADVFATLPSLAVWATQPIVGMSRNRLELVRILSRWVPFLLGSLDNRLADVKVMIRAAEHLGETGETLADIETAKATIFGMVTQRNHLNTARALLVQISNGMEKHQREILGCTLAEANRYLAA